MACRVPVWYEPDFDDEDMRIRARIWAEIPAGMFRHITIFGPGGHPMAGAQPNPLICCDPASDDYLVDVDPSRPFLDREVIVFEADGSVLYPRMLRHQYFKFCSQGHAPRVNAGARPVPGDRSSLRRAADRDPSPSGHRRPYRPYRRSRRWPGLRP